MDTEYLRRHYDLLSDQELFKTQNGELMPQARVILEAEIVKRGLKINHSSNEHATEQSIASPAEHELARKLWKSYLVRICQILFMLPAWLPINHAIHRSGISIGALWMGLLAVLCSYAGYKIGYAITKSICANDQRTYQQKRGSIWFLILGVFIVYFALFVLVGAVVPVNKRGQF